jgi:hypothetical protein
MLELTNKAIAAARQSRAAGSTWAWLRNRSAVNLSISKGGATVFVSSRHGCAVDDEAKQ